MSIENIKAKLFSQSKESGWLEKAIWRQENEDWLDLSFSIAVKILSALRENKKADNSLPKNQKELAEVMGCSAQYINKLLRGQENLQIETICKIQRILNIKLIEVPNASVSTTIKYQAKETWLGEMNIESSETKTSNKYSNFIVEYNYEYAA